MVLFWADRKPLERRGVLLCLIPVILAYLVVEIVGIQMGVIAFANTLLPLIMQVILIVLCIFSYLRSLE